MLPNKLTHGEKLADLFRKYNERVDYLRETRLVAGPGMRINRLPAGITIESTATSVATSAGSGTSAVPASVSGPFDVETVNTGTEENPEWEIRVCNSNDRTDSGIAGLLIIGNSQFEVAEDELDPPEGYSYVYLDVTYDLEEEEYFHELKITENHRLPQAGEREYIEVIAIIYHKVDTEPKITLLRPLENITVTGRWV